MLLKAVQCWPAATKGFLKVREGLGYRMISHEYPVRSVSHWDHWEVLEWVVISELPWPQPYSYNTRETIICAIHHSGGGVGGTRAQGLMIKHSSTMHSESWSVYFSMESKPWNCFPWVCVSWWRWKSRMGLLCHSECCWSCPVDTG